MAHPSPPPIDPVAASDAWTWTFVAAHAQLSLHGDVHALGLSPHDADDALPALFARIGAAERSALDALLRAPEPGRSLTFRLSDAEGRSSLWRGRWSADGATAHGLAVPDDRSDSFGRDALTGLLDRANLAARASQRLAEGAGARLVVADLARFRRLNEAFGPERADLVLAALGGRLLAAFPTECAAARIGEDEFGVLLPLGQEDPSIRLRAALERPLRVGGFDIHPALTVGVGDAAPGEDCDGFELLRRAGVALDAARAARPPEAAYAADAEGQGLMRLALEADLRRALVRGELEAFYQPVVSLADGRIAGFEALVRWRHPHRGLLSPDEFLPLLGETGQMSALGRHMLRTAADQLAKWRDLHPQEARDLFLSVNLTCGELERPSIAAEVGDVIARAGIPPGRLKLELTEGEVMRDPEAASEVLHALKAAGAGLAIDDFGMGYSSLSYLARLPLDTLKIDRYFVRGFGVNAASTTVLNSIVALGRDLGLQIVAEGIETRAVAARLAELGCDYGQGYRYAPPLPAAEATAYLLSQSGLSQSGLDAQPLKVAG